MSKKKPVSFSCPVCGEFKGFPLASQAELDDHVRNVHGDPLTNAGGEDLAPFLLDRLHGCAELLDASEGACEDECGHIGRRVWIGGRQVCKACGRRRLTAARKAAA